jgi:phytoene/squalene synthetase
MSKYHVREGGCARAQTGLSVDIEDFRKMLASSKCEVCRKKTERSELETYRYRVETTSGEFLSYVRATDEGDAYRKAAVKFCALGMRVRMV